MDDTITLTPLCREILILGMYPVDYFLTLSGLAMLRLVAREGYGMGVLEEESPDFREEIHFHQIFKIISTYFPRGGLRTIYSCLRPTLPGGTGMQWENCIRY